MCVCVCVCVLCVWCVCGVCVCVCVDADITERHCQTAYLWGSGVQEQCKGRVGTEAGGLC